ADHFGGQNNRLGFGKAKLLQADPTHTPSPLRGGKPSGRERSVASALLLNQENGGEFGPHPAISKE
ncbi:MAG: hypothetical protein RDU76_11870, partial [Candidatus Edwardsbacteria bacterium]|nr:hypothetical protein [Candidatus Edwardsbacteria bacterium]